MVTNRIAVRYAKSLIQLASEKSVLQQIKADVDLIQQSLKQNRELLLFSQSPVVESDKKLQVFIKIFSGKLSEMSMNFLKLVFEKKREIFLLQMMESFIMQFNDIMGFQTAEVKTASPLTEDLRQQFIQAVKDYSGKKPILSEKVDPEIIGGFVLTIGDRQLDESISSRLQRLRAELLNA